MPGVTMDQARQWLSSCRVVESIVPYLRQLLIGGDGSRAEAVRIEGLRQM